MNKEKELDKRFWEIDFLRGIALIGMIVYHLIFDLNYFEAIQVDLNNPIWFYLAHGVAFTFIYIAGIALSLSYTRAKLKQKKDLTKKYLKRGTKIFSYGLIITLVTYVFIPDAYIVFGILHFIGLSIILAIPFLDKKYLNIPVAVITLIIGSLLNQITFDSLALVWLGIKPIGFYSVDYFPIFPWFSLILLGITTGKILYHKYKRRVELPNKEKTPVIKEIKYLGKKSLIIYFLHQPIIIITLILLGIIDLGTLL